MSLKSPEIDDLLYEFETAAITVNEDHPSMPPGKAGQDYTKARNRICFLVSNYEAELADLQYMNGTLKGLLEQRSDQVEELEAERDNALAENEHLHATEKQVAVLTAALAAAEAEREELREKLAAARAQIREHAEEDCLAELFALKAKIAVQRHTIERLQVEADTAGGYAEDADKALAKAKELEAEVSELKEKLEVLQGRGLEP